MIGRRSLIGTLLAAPAIIRTPGLLMPVLPPITVWLLEGHVSYPSLGAFGGFGGAAEARSFKAALACVMRRLYPEGDVKLGYAIGYRGGEPLGTRPHIYRPGEDLL